jgi:predicted patatin/cPLA2 family phospholipase
MTADHHPPISGMDSNIRRGLVLAGGGMRVAYQAGAVKALYDEGLRFSFADATSGGTFNLAALLSGLTPDELCQRWRTLSPKRFVSFASFWDYLHVFNLPGLGTTKGFEKHVYPKLGVDLEKIRHATGIEAYFNVCRFDDKTVQSLPHDQLDLPRLIAAASLPIFMPAIQHQGHTWTDAVWIDDANLLNCVKRGAHQIWLIWCIGNSPVYKNGAFNQYVHMIEMSAAGALNRDLETIAEINARIAKGETVYGNDQPIEVFVVKPEIPIPLDPDYYFGRIDGATLIDMGYRDARRALSMMTPSPLNEKATMMQKAETGISFRETMSGNVTLDPSATPNPEALALNATIHIDDIKAFVADPQHKAGLTGHIDYAPMGFAMPSESGVFGLFTPSGDPALTYMIYELGFRHNNQPYYLAGKKHVRIGPLWKLWKETTTLYVTLHSGSDDKGPVIGTGVLSLGVSQLLKLLLTLHATDANSTAQNVGAVWRFFRFFAKELLRTYIFHRPL